MNAPFHVLITSYQLVSCVFRLIIDRIWVPATEDARVGGCAGGDWVGIGWGWGELRVGDVSFALLHWRLSSFHAVWKQAIWKGSFVLLSAVPISPRPLPPGGAGCALFSANQVAVRGAGRGAGDQEQLQVSGRTTQTKNVFKKISIAGERFGFLMSSLLHSDVLFISIFLSKRYRKASTVFYTLWLHRKVQVGMITWAY